MGEGAGESDGLGGGEQLIGRGDEESEGLLKEGGQA